MFKQGPSKIKTGGQSTIDRFLSPRSMLFLRNLPSSTSTVPCQQVQEVHGIAPAQIQQTIQVQPGDLIINEAMSRLFRLVTDFIQPVQHTCLT